MINIKKFYEIKGLSCEVFYKLSTELDKEEIGYGAKPNRKDSKKIDVLVDAEDLTRTITLISKVKSQKGVL